ncbi:phosphate:acyl-[acyl carrier protein] acyltransferase [Mycoplasmopsis mustelae]|uniref:Phosphate acyltransferase n=1 Tax=Mycoplasmopsis mustelae TaxID=171289 RepID=A0A4R7UD35_9BACT|nr:phosphate acyltransferase PlsX [Mycoplasmopsis mustelae]TDV24329.1 phosphate:acyl-[acyl carrier protein] acyltransferase [Mycoplasmopsis mustelae]
MNRIVLDANGLDLSPQVAYDAALEFCLQNKDVKVILIGDIKKADRQLNNLEVIFNDYKNSDPRNILGGLKKPTSMNKAIELLQDNQVDGIISGGDSGSYISALTLKAKRLPNLSRPAFMPIISTLNNQKMLLLDVGANLEIKAEYLYEWAKLADVFYQTMFDKTNPKISLVNIGTEPYKGPQITRDAHQLILNDKSLNYIGFVESRNLLDGQIDIGVIDGYGGNLIIKSYEGAITSFKNSLKNEIKNSLKAKIGALFLKQAFKNIALKLDYRNVASAWVIGVNALALKVHGASDRKTLYNALKQMNEAIKKDLLNKLTGALNE